MEDAIAHVARVEVPAALRPAEHLPGTWKLRLSGHGSITARPESIGAALLANGLIKTMATWKQAKYYRLQQPFERFVSFGGCQDKPTLSHGLKIEAAFDVHSATRGQIEFFDLEERETRFTLQYVPPGATHRYIGAVLARAGIPNVKKTERSVVRQDLWYCAADCQEDEVPHFIASTNLTSKPLPADKTAIMVSVPGRPIKCYHCGDPGHWSNKCTQGREVRQQRYQDRENAKKRALEQRRLAEQQLIAAAEQLEKDKEERRVDELLKENEKNDESLLADGTANEPPVSPTGSKDSESESDDSEDDVEDDASQDGELVIEEEKSAGQRTPPKQPGSPSGKGGSSRGRMSLHTTPPNARKSAKRERQQEDQMSAKRQSAHAAANESMSMDTRDFYAAVGLSTVGLPDDNGKAAIQKLKKKLFRPEAQNEGEESVVTVESSDGDDDSTSKEPEPPAGRGSPVLTASGNIPSYQVPSKIPSSIDKPREDQTPSSAPTGNRESIDIQITPPSVSSTPVLLRTMRNIKGKFEWGGSSKKEDKTKLKETPSSQGEQSGNQMN